VTISKSPPRWLKGSLGFYEANANSRLLPPDDTTRHIDVVGFDHQREVFGYTRPARLRSALHPSQKSCGFAIDGAASKRDFACLQQSTAGCGSLLVHGMHLALLLQHSQEPPYLSTGHNAGYCHLFPK
jgi:hypothetical protein